MRTWEIITPTDVFSFKASSFEIAAQVNFLLTEGHCALYGTKLITNESQRMPILTDPQHHHQLVDNWFQQQFKRSQRQSLHWLLQSQYRPLMNALNSVVIGDRIQYAEFDAHYSRLPATRRQDFRQQWCRARSSVLALADTAWNLANQISQSTQEHCA